MRYQKSFIFVGPRWYFHNPTNRHKPRFGGGCHIWQQWTHDRNHSVASNRPFVSYHNLHSTVKHPTAGRKQERLWSFVLLCPSYARRGVYYYLCSRDISSVGTDSYPGTTTRLSCTGRRNTTIFYSLPLKFEKIIVSQSNLDCSDLYRGVWSK